MKEYPKCECRYCFHSHDKGDISVCVDKKIDCSVRDGQPCSFYNKEVRE